MKEGQSTPYCLTPVPILQEYITSLQFIPESEYLQHRSACGDRSATNSPSFTRSRSSTSLSADMDLVSPFLIILSLNVN